MAREGQGYPCCQHDMMMMMMMISELTVVTRVMQRSFNELSTSVSDYVKCKQTGVYTYTLNSLVNVGVGC